jgi:hypothetical protein
VFIWKIFLRFVSTAGGEAVSSGAAPALFRVKRPAGWLEKTILDIDRFHLYYSAAKNALRINGSRDPAPNGLKIQVVQGLVELRQFYAKRLSTKRLR